MGKEPKKGLDFIYREKPVLQFITAVFASVLLFYVIWGVPEPLTTVEEGKTKDTQTNELDIRDTSSSPLADSLYYEIYGGGSGVNNSANHTRNFNCGDTIKDIDKNEYRTTRIGGLALDWLHSMK